MSKTARIVSRLLASSWPSQPPRRDGRAAVWTITYPQVWVCALSLPRVWVLVEFRLPEVSLALQGRRFVPNSPQSQPCWPLSTQEPHPTLVDGLLRWWCCGTSLRYTRRNDLAHNGSAAQLRQHLSEAVTMASPLNPRCELSCRRDVLARPSWQSVGPSCVLPGDSAQTRTTTRCLQGRRLPPEAAAFVLDRVFVATRSVPALRAAS